MDRDMMIRIAAFDWLAGQVDIHGDVLPRTLLQEGFEFQGQRVPLISPQGIFKPKVMDLPLSITTSFTSPYDDAFGAGGFLHYRYRGTDPNHRDNVGLRQVFNRNLPLVYLHAVVRGRYLATWPVYITGDDPDALTFRIAVDDVASVATRAEPSFSVNEGTEARQAYITTTIRQRLHQRTFRERVLDAYRSQCAFCRLRHRELLDAAHIVPDHMPEGRPTVSNGLALCKLHHAAYDSFMIGVSPDYVIHVREDILEEEDGPVLLHGLQGIHNRKLILPSARVDWPSPELLDWRYDRFLHAA
jgi:putative restriction endonuclease